MKAHAFTAFLCLLLLSPAFGESAAKEQKAALAARRAAASPFSPDVRKKLTEKTNTLKGTVGLVAQLKKKNPERIKETSDSFSLNPDRDMPMQSVYKFPICLAVLDQVDKGRLSLDEMITVTPSELPPDTWSPLRDKHPEGGRFPLSELIAFAMQQSDNNACDILLRQIGGPAQVGEYLSERAFLDAPRIHVLHTEEELHQSPDRQYQNSATPRAMAGLLAQFHEGRLLGKKGTEFLNSVMLSTTTGASRIRGLLPQGTPVAHKTGTSGPSPDGTIAALNDVGLISLPNGDTLILCLFIQDCKNTPPEIERFMAECAALLYTDLLKAQSAPAPQRN